MKRGCHFVCILNVYPSVTAQIGFLDKIIHSHFHLSSVQQAREEEGGDPVTGLLFLRTV